MYGTRKGVGLYIGWPICGYSGMPPAVPNPGLSGIRKGLRGCGCGCASGLNLPAGTMYKCCKGLGYFDTGWDISGWSYMEWGTVALIAYMMFSTVSTTQRGYRKAKRRIRRFQQ